MRPYLIKHKIFKYIMRPYLIKHEILKGDIGRPSFRLPRAQTVRGPNSGILTTGAKALKNVKGGMLVLSNKPIHYIFYNNINEIVDRLRLLRASRSI